MVFSYWVQSTSLAEKQVLIHSRRHSKLQKEKIFQPYEETDHPDKTQNTEISPYYAFHSELRSCKPLEVEYTDYFNRLKSVLSTEQAFIKWQLSKPTPTAIEEYQHLQNLWKPEPMSSTSTFNTVTETKTLFQFWMQCKKRLTFTATTLSIR